VKHFEKRVGMLDEGHVVADGARSYEV
jgi:hypothetical protein